MEALLVAVGGLLGIVNALMLFVLKQLHTRIAELEKMDRKFITMAEARIMMDDKLAPLDVKIDAINMKLTLLLNQIHEENIRKDNNR